MDLIGFTLAIAPIALSPGASFTLAINNAIQHGIRGTGKIITGTLLGIYTHTFLAGVGITRLVVTYSSLVNTLKILGTAYLLYLAARLIRSGLNIKAVMLYLTVVPVFAGSGGILLLSFTLRSFF